MEADHGVPEDAVLCSQDEATRVRRVAQEQDTAQRLPRRGPA